MATEKKPIDVRPGTAAKKPEAPKPAPPAVEGQPGTAATAAVLHQKAPVEPATKATIRSGTVRLRDLEFAPDGRYCHREPADLTRAALRPLMNSIVSENGLQVPTEYVVVDGKRITTRGHRRVQSCRFLAEDGVPGFHLDMEIPANEVLGASPGDLLVRSILDNENRAPLKGFGLLNAIKLLVEIGIDDQRAALALNVSPQTYKRDKLLVLHPWMHDLVLNNKINQTAAFVLLDEAVKAAWVAEFQAGLNAWIALKEQELEEADRLHKETTGKEMKASDQHVRKFLRNDLMAHWIGQIRRQEPLALDVQWDFPAGFEVLREEVHLGGKKISLRDLSPEGVAKFVGKLGLVVKDVAKYAKKRHELERLAGETQMEGEGLDENLLRALGLGSIVHELHEDARRAAEELVAGAAEPEGKDQPAPAEEGN